MNGDRSKLIFQNIADLIKNQGNKVEPAKGIIWRAINKAQAHFVEDLGITKVHYELDLFPGQASYPLDSYVLKITSFKVNIRADGSEPCFSFKLDNVTNADYRNLNIVEGLDNILTGDVLTFEAQIAVPDDYQIDEDHDPLIEKRYHTLLEDYVAAGFDTTVTKVKGGGAMSMAEIKQQGVDREVIAKRDATYALNRVRTAKIKQLRFGV